jgi:hypothetical protein
VEHGCVRIIRHPTHPVAADQIRTVASNDPVTILNPSKAHA